MRAQQTLVKARSARVVGQSLAQDGSLLRHQTVVLVDLAQAREPNRLALGIGSPALDFIVREAIYHALLALGLLVLAAAQCRFAVHRLVVAARLLLVLFGRQLVVDNSVLAVLAAEPEPPGAKGGSSENKEADDRARSNDGSRYNAVLCRARSPAGTGHYRASIATRDGLQRLLFVANGVKVGGGHRRIDERLEANLRLPVPTALLVRVLEDRVDVLQERRAQDNVAMLLDDRRDLDRTDARRSRWVIRVWP